MGLFNGIGLLDSLIMMGTRKVVASGMIADYQFTEGSGTSVNDHSGSGNDGTLNGSPLPTWVATGLHFASNAANRVDIPISNANAATVQLLMTVTSGTFNSGFASFLGSSVSSAAQHLLQAGSYPLGDNPLPTPQLSIGGTAYCAIYDMATPNAACVVSIARGAVIDYAQVNGDSISNNIFAGPLSPSAGLGNSGSLSLGADLGNPYNSFEGTIHRALIYNRQLSQSELNTNYAALRAWAAGRGVTGWANPATTHTLMGLGDSITAASGASSYANGWFAKVVAAATQNFTNYNLGIPGQSILSYAGAGTFNCGIATYGPNFIRRIRASGASKNVAILFAGTNDCYFGGTAAATFAGLQSTVSNLLAIGPDMWVILVPMLSRTGGGGSGSYDTFKNTYNGLIAGYSWGSSVTLVSPSSLPHLCPDGSSANLAWFADGTHPTDAGHLELATAIGAAVEAVDPFVPGSHLLDSIRPQAKAAYSTRKLSSVYSGPAIRVRRSSDNTEQDIGFSGDDLDAAALAAFVGSNNGFVSKWYDQTGNGYDQAQATTANQPQIVVSGAIVTVNSKAAVKFISASATALHPASSPAIDDHTVIATLKAGAAVGGFGGIMSFDAGHGVLMLSQAGGGAAWGSYSSSGQPSGTTLVPGTNYILAMIGKSSSGGGAFYTDAAPDGTYNGSISQAAHIGGLGGQSANFTCGELVVWNTQLGGADFNTVRSNTDTYWGVY